MHARILKEAHELLNVAWVNELLYNIVAGAQLDGNIDRSELIIVACENKFTHYSFSKNICYLLKLSAFLFIHYACMDTQFAPLKVVN